jgi:putative peptidoglycan lipid II flippase
MAVTSVPAHDVSTEEEAATLAPPSSVLKKSLSGSVWTLVSRGTGLARTIMVGAVLGATYLGNTYQGINSIPNLVYYQLLAGALFAALLVPPLVRHIDGGDRQAAQRLVEGLFGTMATIGLLVSLLLVAAGPILLRLITVGVADPAVASEQTRVGWLFLVMFVPQITLYMVAGTGAAVMNAHGRFALAAAAPALEAAGMILVMAVAAWIFGTGTSLLDVSGSELLLLGLGTTAAVGVHAALQWTGARSSGIVIRPRWAWRDPAVREVIRRILPMLAFTALEALQLVAVIVVANKIRGGLLSFQLALNFFFLPTAIITWPIARALLPTLSRHHRNGETEAFHQELVRAVCVASFATIPLAVAYLALSWPIANGVSFGQLATGGGPGLIAPSIAALSFAVVGETWFILATYSCYAQDDVRTPLRSMFVRVGVALAFMTFAILAQGHTVLVLLGLSLSVGSLAGALAMGWRVRGRLRGHRAADDLSLWRSVVWTTVMSLVAVVPAVLLLAIVGPATGSKVAQLAQLGGLMLLTGATYVGLQSLRRARELRWLLVAMRRGGAAAPGTEGPAVTDR